MTTRLMIDHRPLAKIYKKGERALVANVPRLFVVACAIAKSEGTCRRRQSLLTHGKDSHRYFGMALHALARRVLSARSATAAGTPLRLAHPAHHRNQRLLLLSAVSGKLPAV